MRARGEGEGENEGEGRVWTTLSTIHGTLKAQDIPARMLVFHPFIVIV